MDNIIFEYNYQNTDILNVSEIKGKNKNIKYIDIFQTFDNTTKFLTNHTEFGLGIEFQLEESSQYQLSFNRCQKLGMDDLHGCGIILSKNILSQPGNDSA